MASGCWTAPPPATPIHNVVAPPSGPPRLPAPPAAEFGLFDSDGALHPTLEVPLFAGSVFGWRIQVACQPGDAIKVREELRLPAPGDWGTDPDLEISKDARVAHVHSVAACRDGWIEKSWTVSPNDPPGAWVVRVTAAGFATKTFRATFAPPAP